MSFNSFNLDPRLLKNVQAMDFEEPTPIQSATIPSALEGRDILGSAETGTGKTLAYLLPIYQNINPVPETQVIIMTPTHELCIQIQRQMERLSKNSGLPVTSTPLIGGVNIERQIEKLKKRPQIVVGSAGRILELIRKKKLVVAKVRVVVLDEADRLLDKFNVDGVLDVLDTLRKDRQTLFVSATISNDALASAQKLSPGAELVKTAEKPAIPDTIEHYFFTAEQRDKIETLRKLIRIYNPAKALVFVNQSAQIDNVTSKLQFLGVNAGSLHGTNIKEDRKRILEDFRKGRIKVMVASEIAARGLDIEDVTHVFNMDMPEHSRGYIHRIGRTGRKGKAGVAVSIVTESELPVLKSHEKNLKIQILEREMHEGKIAEVYKR